MRRTIDDASQSGMAPWGVASLADAYSKLIGFYAYCYFIVEARLICVFLSDGKFEPTPTFVDACRAADEQRMRGT